MILNAIEKLIHMLNIIFLGNQCILNLTPIILNLKLMDTLFCVIGAYLNEINYLNYLYICINQFTI